MDEIEIHWLREEGTASAEILIEGLPGIGHVGKLVAEAKDIPLKELYQQYQTILMEALQVKATPKKNANVLMHMMGYFKEQLSSDEKQELLEVIDHYRQEYIPLIVPITLINHYVRKYRQPYLKQQIYLNPHPLERQLRNHV
jgi:uncharacterized protein YbgA (DUF1722 family)